MTVARIAVAVDLSPASEPAAWLAAAVADRHGAQVMLVHVDAPPLLAAVAVEPMFVPPQWLDALRRPHEHEVSGKLAWLRDRLRERYPDLRVDSQTQLDDPAKGIVRAATSLAADLIVMTTRGASATRFLLGGVAAKVAQRAACPVLIADHGAGAASPGSFRRVLCGVDHSRFSRPVVMLAGELVDPAGHIELCHVWHEPRLGWLAAHPERDAVVQSGVEHETRRLVDLATTGFPVPPATPTLTVEIGDAAPRLLDRAGATNADLIVIGAHGDDVEGRALGTVADRVIRHASASVLVVPTAALVGQGAQR